MTTALPNISPHYLRCRRLTLRSATGTAQRARPYQHFCPCAIGRFWKDSFMAEVMADKVRNLG
jgi:hypothetical protein